MFWNDDERGSLRISEGTFCAVKERSETPPGTLQNHLMKFKNDAYAEDDVFFVRSKGTDGESLNVTMES